MADEVAVAISGLLEGNPERNISSIKSAVIAQFIESDQSVVPETTEYFNHTYAPDIVLHWRSGRLDRRVYLRTYSNPSYLLEDIHVVAADQPILMPLTPMHSTDAKSPGLAEGQNDTVRLAEDSARASTLVAGPSTFSALSEDRHNRPIGSIVSRAVLQGGRGLIDEERARSVGVTMHRAYTAAQQAESLPTQAAISAAETLLNQAQAIQLETLFQALWLGSGAPATTFPGRTNLSSSLDAIVLQVLLNMDVAISGGYDFWRRLGSELTLENLCAVEMRSQSPNLQWLVNVNIDRLQARSCQVNDFDGFVDSDNANMTWFLERGLLGLSSARFRAYFSPDSIARSDYPQMTK